MTTSPLFSGYGVCEKPLRTGGFCQLPLDHKTKHHTKCVFWCERCGKTSRGRGPCFLCKQLGEKVRGLRRRYG